MITITLKEWERVENLDGANQALEWASGFCANGKMNLLIHGDINYPKPFLLELNILAQAAEMNNTSKVINADGSFSLDLRSFDKTDPQWEQHIRAFRWLMMEYVKAGVCELEDDLAKEFSKLESKEPLALCNTK